MADMRIGDDERQALAGLPYAAQLLYLMGLRPHMDYGSGIVGHARRISWQMLREVLYVEPHKGVPDAGTPSLGKTRRALDWLIREGLVEDLGSKQRGEAIVFRLPLATTDSSEQKKPGKNPARTRQGKADTLDTPVQTEETTTCIDQNPIPGKYPARVDTPKAGTPPVSGIRKDKEGTDVPSRANSGKQPKYTEADRDMAKAMLQRIQQVAPHQKGSAKWPDVIRLMREQDGLTHAQIWEAFDWANQDDFWATNILSPSALRKQYGRLEAKMLKEGQGAGTTPNSRDNQQTLERFLAAGAQ